MYLFSMLVLPFIPFYSRGFWFLAPGDVDTLPSHLAVGSKTKALIGQEITRERQSRDAILMFLLLTNNIFVLKRLRRVEVLCLVLCLGSTWDNFCHFSTHWTCHVSFQSSFDWEIVFSFFAGYEHVWKIILQKHLVNSETLAIPV